MPLPPLSLQVCKSAHVIESVSRTSDPITFLSPGWLQLLVVEGQTS